MKTKPFQFPMQAGSPEELAERIAGHESRGFEVVRYFEVEKESSGTIESNYVDASGVTRRMNVGSFYKSYGAVMRRVESS